MFLLLELSWTSNLGAYATNLLKVVGLLLACQVLALLRPFLGSWCALKPYAVASGSDSSGCACSIAQAVSCSFSLRYSGLGFHVGTMHIEQGSGCLNLSAARLCISSSSGS